MDALVLSCAVAFLCGMLANELICRLQKAYGVLRIDRSNPAKDAYRFEIDNLEVLATKKYIVLKVDNNADLSQK